MALIETISTCSEVPGKTLAGGTPFPTSRTKAFIFSALEAQPVILAEVRGRDGPKVAARNSSVIPARSPAFGAAIYACKIGYLWLLDGTS